MIEEFSGDFLQQLRGFYYVAQLGSMGQAAKVMHRSQSSVSRLIKQLEQSLGVELFSRVQKGVVLTSEGSDLFAEAVAIFEHIRSVHSELGQASAKEPQGDVSFQVSHSAFFRFIAPQLPDLYKNYPKLRLNILEAGNLARTQKRLEERTIDFAVAVGGAIRDGLGFFPLFSDKMLLAAPKSLAGEIKEPIALEKLPELPFIRLPSGSGFSIFIETHLSASWLATRQTLIADNSYYQLHMVAAGLGLAITTEASLEIVKDLPLAVFDLKHIIPPQEYGLIYLKNSYITPQARAVMDFLKKCAQEE